LESPAINLKTKIDNQNNYAIATVPKIFNYRDRINNFSGQTNTTPRGCKQVQKTFSPSNKLTAISE